MKEAVLDFANVLPTEGARAPLTRRFVFALTILLGQILIVQFGGAVFRTVPLTLGEWAITFGLTSFVLWIGEAVRLWRGADEPASASEITFPSVAGWR